MTGKLLKLETSPAKYTRRGVDPSVYWFVQSFAEPHPFAPDSVFHLLEPDINQELYGMPEYLSALNSAWLNESATLFRRKYYQNGAHAGYIMYVTDAAQNSTDVEALRSAMNSSKGMGNFKTCSSTRRTGSPTVSRLCRSARWRQRMIFQHQKVSAADLLDAHRIPYQLMGGKPENVGSVGDVEKAARVFVRNELTPLQQRIKEVNDWVGVEVIRFKSTTSTTTTNDKPAARLAVFYTCHQTPSHAHHSPHARIYPRIKPAQQNATTTR